MKRADTLFGAHTSGEETISVISLDKFVPAFVEPSLSTAELQRKFCTFLLASKARNSAFRAALNTSEEQFALKSPLFLAQSTIPSKEPIRADKECIEETQRIMLLEEYRNAQAVSNIKGFPKVYGLGYMEGYPIMVSEYIEGTTLAKAIDKYLPTTKESLGLTPYIAATIIQTVTAILLNARCLDGTFVHRDLSPRNIIIKTDERTLNEQLKQGLFDLRLVDMGSATYQVPESPFKTAKHGIWRFGTAEYAAPEMLTRDIEGIAAKRYSETIDTYALCSILYLMLTGETPFSLATRISESPYLIKTKERPTKSAVSTENSALIQLATKGITAKQEDRYTVTELYRALDAWRHNCAKENGLKNCPPPSNFALYSNAKDHTIASIDQAPMGHNPQQNQTSYALERKEPALYTYKPPMNFTKTSLHAKGQGFSRTIFLQQNRSLTPPYQCRLTRHRSRIKKARKTLTNSEHAQISQLDPL